VRELLDARVNRDAVRVVTERKHRRENQLFELTEGLVLRH
jgi:hypothetical protein